MYYWEYEIRDLLENSLGIPREYGLRKWWRPRWGTVILQGCGEGAISSYVEVHRGGKKEVWTTYRNGRILHDQQDFIGDLLEVLLERIS